ncbi:MAG TPA: universal stress protein [Acidimicrobiales bacterium]
MSYRRIVVGTDGSETATKAVEHAARLASSVGAAFIAVTAFDPRPPGLDRDRAEAPEEIKWRITASGLADDHAQDAVRLARQEGVREASAVSEAGTAAEALLEVADRRRADLIVVGSKGMSSAGRFLLGSVPNAVSHHAPCDVMIVRTG